MLEDRLCGCCANGTRCTIFQVWRVEVLSHYAISSVSWYTFKMNRTDLWHTLATTIIWSFSGTCKKCHSWEPRNQFNKSVYPSGIDTAQISVLFLKDKIRGATLRLCLWRKKKEAKKGFFTRSNAISLKNNVLLCIYFLYLTQQIHIVIQKPAHFLHYYCTTFALGTNSYIFIFLLVKYKLWFYHFASFIEM